MLSYMEPARRSASSYVTSNRSRLSGNRSCIKLGITKFIKGFVFFGFQKPFAFTNAVQWYHAALFSLSVHSCCPSPKCLVSAFY